MTAGQPLLKVDGLEALPLERQVRVARVALDGLHLKARPMAGGAAPVVPTPSGASDPTSTGTDPVTPWQWSVGALHLAACEGDDRLLGFPIHPNDPLRPLNFAESCR